jgi:uncharacterized protein (DUF488 family)
VAGKGEAPRAKKSPLLERKACFPVRHCGARLAPMVEKPRKPNSKRPGRTKPLFTIGYEGASQAGLIGALKAVGVETLIDVRELPNSRRAGFSRKTLSASLAQAGIGYVHLKALGTPKAGREANKAGRMTEFWKIVDGALSRPEAGLALEQAAEIAAASKACLLCLEHDHTICHRERVAEMLAARGFRVEHLEPEPIK